MTRAKGRRGLPVESVIFMLGGDGFEPGPPHHGPTGGSNPPGGRYSEADVLTAVEGAEGPQTVNQIAAAVTGSPKASKAARAEIDRIVHGLHHRGELASEGVRRGRGKGQPYTGFSIVRDSPPADGRTIAESSPPGRRPVRTTGVGTSDPSAAPSDHLPGTGRADYREAPADVLPFDSGGAFKSARMDAAMQPEEDMMQCANCGKACKGFPSGGECLECLLAKAETPEESLDRLMASTPHWLAQAWDRPGVES